MCYNTLRLSVVETLEVLFDASVAQSVEQLIRNQQVRCSSHPTSSIKRPENHGFRGVLLCKKFWFSEGGKLATHTQTHTGEKTQRTGREVRLPNRCAVLFVFGCPYRTCAMKLPMVWAASSCFWRVVWV